MVILFFSRLFVCFEPNNKKDAELNNTPDTLNNPAQEQHKSKVFNAKTVHIFKEQREKNITQNLHPVKQGNSKTNPKANSKFHYKCSFHSVSFFTSFQFHKKRKKIPFSSVFVFKQQKLNAVQCLIKGEKKLFKKQKKIISSHSVSQSVSQIQSSQCTDPAHVWSAGVWILAGFLEQLSSVDSGVNDPGG